MRDGDLLGRMLDTSSPRNSARSLLSAGETRLYHVREKNRRREIDLLIEMGAHRVMALR